MGMGGPGSMRMGPRGFLTEEEKKNKPKVDKKLLRRIASYMKPYKLQFALVFLAILLSAGASSVMCHDRPLVAAHAERHAGRF